MDKKSKILFLIMGVLMLGSITVTYYRYIVKRDYIIQAQAICDPYTEKCFVYVCDPETGEECTGDPVEDTSYYKLINRNAKNIPLCDPNDENCDALVCPEGEADCSFTLCDSTEEGIVCNDPAAYTLENPVEEEEGIEEESDEEEEATSESEGDVTDTVESDASEEVAPQDTTSVKNVKGNGTGASQTTAPLPL